MSTSTASDLELAEEIFHRVAGDLSMITDRTLTAADITVRKQNERAVGEGGVHISFKLLISSAEKSRHGCLLVPLPDAIALANYLMMVPDDLVVRKREETSLDSTTKDAMLEVGSFVASAANTSIQALGMEHLTVRSEGCQGVRADVRPALEYKEGDPLVIGEVTAQLHDFPAFRPILILPELAKL